MKAPKIDESEMPEVMELIEKAASIMEENRRSDDAAVKQELDDLQNRLRNITGLGDLTDYIFYPHFKGMDGNATLEQIADKIIADKNNLQ